MHSYRNQSHQSHQSQDSLEVSLRFDIVSLVEFLSLVTFYLLFSAYKTVIIRAIKPRSLISNYSTTGTRYSTSRPHVFTYGRKVVWQAISDACHIPWMNRGMIQRIIRGSYHSSLNMLTWLFSSEKLARVMIDRDRNVKMGVLFSHSSLAGAAKKDFS